MSKVITIDIDVYENMQRLLSQSEFKDQRRLFEEFLFSIKKMVEDQAELHLPKEMPRPYRHMITRPQVFISYAWEAEGNPKKKHLRNLLRQLADDLEKTGLRVWLDLRHMHGKMPQKMLTNIETSQYVLIIGTHTYAGKTEPGSQTNVNKELEFALKETKENDDFLVPLLLEGDYGTTFSSGIRENLIRDCRSCFSLEQGEWKSFYHYMKIMTQCENPLGIVPALLGLNRIQDHKEYREACVHAYKRLQLAFMNQLKLMAMESKVEKLKEDKDQLMKEQKRLSDGIDAVKKQRKIHGNNSRLSENQQLMAKQKELEEQQEECKRSQEKLKFQENRLNTFLQEQSDRATALSLWAEELEKQAKKQQQFDIPENKSITYVPAGTELKIPGKGSCLFWSVAIGVLILVLDDQEKYRIAFNDLFFADQKDEMLFDKYGDMLRSRIKSFVATNDTSIISEEQGDSIYHLINWYFRQKVASYIDRHCSRFEGFIENRPITEYVTSLREESFWGGHVEIRAIYEMLGKKHRIIVENTSIDFGTQEVPVVTIVHTNFKGKKQGQKNHYNLKMPDLNSDHKNQPEGVQSNDEKHNPFEILRGPFASLSKLGNLLTAPFYKSSEEKTELPSEDETTGLSPLALKKLNNPELKLTAEESIECLVSYINRGRKEAEKAKGRDLIVFLGNTGSGKSTTINYLHGCQMESVERSAIDGEDGPNVIRVAQSSQIKELTLVGHSQDESKTFMPKIVTDDLFTYCDCPGFLDTRGAEIKIANLANIKNVLQNAKSIKIVVIIAYESLIVDKQSSKTKLIKMLNDFFSSVDDIEKGKISLLIGVTQLPIGFSITLEGTKKKICSDKAPKFIHALNSNIFLFDPAERKEYKNISNRQQVIKKINDLRAMTVSPSFCKMPLGPEEIVKLEEISGMITRKIAACFESKSIPLTEIKSEAIQKAAGHLKTLGYLKIIDHEKVNTLYQKALSYIKDFVGGLEQKARSLINAYQFTEAEKLLNTIQLISDNFSPELNFKDMYNGLKEFLFQKRVDEADQRVTASINTLSELFFKDSQLQEQFARKLQEKSAGELYNQFNRAGLYLISNSIDQIELLKNIPALCTAAGKLQSDFRNLQLLTMSFFLKNPLFQKQVIACGDLVKKIADHLYTIIVRNLNHELTDLNSQTLVICSSLEEKIEWGANGKKILSILSDLKENNSLDNFKEVFRILETESSMRESIKKLANFFNRVFEIAGFLKQNNKFEIYKELVYQKLNYIQKKLEQERDREIARQSLSEFIKYLDTHQYLEAGKVLRRIEQLDDKQNGGRIELKNCIKVLLTNLNTQFDKEDYDSAKTNLEYLKQIKSVFSNELARYRIDLDLNKIESEIIIKINRMKEEADQQINSVFNLDKLIKLESEIASESKISTLPQLKSKFFVVAKVFEPLIKDSKTEFSKMREQLLIKISDVYKNFLIKFKREEITANIMALFFVQLRSLASATTLPQFIDRARKITQEFLLVNDQVDLSMKMGDMLKKCNKCDEISSHAAAIIEEHVEFKRISIQLFNAKASKTSEEIFSELKIRPTAELKVSYDEYYRTYEAIVSEVITEAKLESPSWGTIKTKVVSKAKSLGKTLENKLESSNSLAMGKLLGYIFGAWTYLDAQDTGRGKFLSDKTTLLQPHAMQAISVLLLLGVGHNGGIQNHLIQVKTGEGKSLIAAGIAIAFALFGYRIDIGCYSSYLSTRDKEQFAKLFSLFSVSGYINYDQFDNLIEGRNREVGDVRELARQLLEDKVVGRTRTTDGAKRLLFVDEVDVFFSENFLGKTYYPGVWLHDSDFLKLLFEIWEKRDSYLADWSAAEREISSHDLLKKFLSKYPNTNIFLEPMIEQIKLGLARTIRNYRPYKLLPKNSDQKQTYYREGIGYADEISGDISFSQYGYETAFAYIKESKQFSPGVVKNHVGFLLNAGVISYGELPNHYPLILGVTGTLDCLHLTEKEIIKKYKIDKQTIMPSLFPKKPLIVDKIAIFGGKIDAEDSKGYFYNIKEDIQSIILDDRAVLVVFEDLARLELFQKFISDHPYSRLTRVKCNDLLPSLDHGEKNRVIVEAAARGQITLTTKRFGRGSDFICRDSAMKEKGVHVIQAFFSEHESEEVQIKGRTCRQDDKGSYSMILFLKDLCKKFDITSQSEIDQFPPPQPGMSEDDRVYAFLKSKRDQHLEKEMKGLITSMNQVKETHQKTIKFIELLEGSKNSIFSSESIPPTEKQKKEAIELMQSFQL